MIALKKQKKGPGHIELVDENEPRVGSGQVRIAVEAAGICGTDLHIAHDSFPYTPPLTLGHEFSGIIESVGNDVEGLAIGDRVISEPTATFCRQCPACHRGQTNLCPKRQAYGIHRDGGFAPLVVVRQGAVHRIPPNVDFNSAAMTEPLAVCVHALIERTGLYPGQLVLINGPGPIGLLSALVAKAYGATVVVVGTANDASRLTVATEIGVDKVVQIERDDLINEIKTLAEDEGGADLTVEAAGAAASVEMACQCTRKGGTIVQLGLFEGQIKVDYSQISIRELTIVGCFAHCWNSFEHALKLMDRKIVNVAPLISDVLPLNEWEQGFQRAEKAQGAKILLAPGSV